MVISARYKAPEVWYSIVGEEKKPLPNEVWYNINEEITKDASEVENANNQTTTGMADEIPWINSPKLIASTSIAWNTKSIAEISDCLSVDERQPVVDRVLAGEFVAVHTIFTPYNYTTQWYLIPTTKTDLVIRFQSIWVWTQWVRINCWITSGKITSITSANWSI